VSFYRESFIVYQGINFGGVGLGHEAPASGGLIPAAQRGDRAAFQELINDYEPLVLRVALNVTGSQEAAQQIYCRVFKDAFVSLSQLNSGSSVFIWLYRILCRRCIEHFQKHPNVFDRDSLESDFRSRLSRAFCSLPPTARVVLQLKQYEGLKIRTLAEIFDTTPEFVIKSLQDANTHLRGRLKSDLNRVL
jgi:RNA polymerase sigma-70 factor (ECF subfamily)